jgi:hypothetical protein
LSELCATDASFGNGLEQLDVAESTCVEPYSVDGKAVLAPA